MEGLVHGDSHLDDTLPPPEHIKLDVHHDDDDAAAAPDSAHPTPHDSPALSPTADGPDGTKAPAPLQKRRRVTRACDECRKKKIKCDGKQPCTHCTVYGYECTYDQPSHRRRNTGPQYIEALEKQLARANAILKTILPGADLSDLTLESKLQQGLLAISPTVATPTISGFQSPCPEQNGSSEIPTDAQLESMVRSTGQLDLDEQGHLEYHGHSSGLSFVKRMREQLGDMMSPDARAPPFAKPNRPLSQVFDSPRSATDSPWDSGLELPSKEEARALCDNAIEDAGSLLRVLHYPSFLKQLDDVYEISHDQYSNEENVFLPLLYSVLALGTLFARDDLGEQELDRKGYESAIAEGFKYFRLARSMMDIADCRDLRQVQALVYMILFLQASAKLSTCYAYIGVALRSAVRMGLHRSFADACFTPIEAETRKRLFWVIQRMDTYVGALLGLPHSLNEDEIDQELPLEVDDQYITETGISPQPEGQIALMAASNAHVRLVRILDKLVKYVYPLKATGTTPQGDAVKSYSVSYAKILEIERDLKNWQDELPMGLKPGGDAPVQIIRVRHLLRMGYAHAQMMLYRPFLHYVSHTCKSRVIDKRSYACAAACVSVSRNIVHIACEMKRKGLLAGAYWFTMYTTFFAILSLVFYALENPDNDASQDVLRVATEGKETLRKLTKRSMAADRCSAILQALFEQLPNRMRRSRNNSVVAKKRKQDAASINSNHNSTPNGDNIPESKPPSRASTFPNVRSKSMDRKPGAPGNVPRFDTIGFPNSNTLNFYDLLHPNNSDSIATPPLTAGLSQRHESFPASPITASEQNFPLADISAVMFPSADPVEYPNENAGAEHTYDEILKSLATDPTFPFPTTLNELKVQRAAGSGTFIPPSSTFMFNGSDPNDVSQMYDNDVQLLGPMPAYMMQGSSFAQQNGNGTGNNGSNTPTDFTSQFLNHSGNHVFAQGSQNNVANVNLDNLLTGEEWASLNQNSDYTTAMSQMFAPQSSGANSFNGGQQHSSVPQSNAGTDMSSARTSTDLNDRSQFNTKNVSFDDLNPGVLGWNLGNY